MANKPKVGLDYFPIEVDFFSDIKVRKLIKYQSGKALSIYTLLLCNIYKEGYYMKWDDELPFVLSETLGYEEGYISEVIKCCFNVGLLSQKMMSEHKVLTSYGIQKRYEIICKQLKRVSIVSEAFRIPSEEIENPTEEIVESSAEKTQRKRNEKKRKETKVNSYNPFFCDLIPESLSRIEGFIENWERWVSFRIEKNKKITPSTAEEQLSWLVKQVDPIAVIKQSIRNGWQGLFELKNEDSKEKNSAKKENQNGAINAKSRAEKINDGYADAYQQTLRILGCDTGPEQV